MGVYEATPLHSPSEIVYRLEHPTKLTRRDNSEHDMPRDMLRLRSTPAGAEIYINNLTDAYNLQDARHLSFRLTATDQARRNASIAIKTQLVTVTTVLLLPLLLLDSLHDHHHCYNNSSNYNNNYY